MNRNQEKSYLQSLGHLFRKRSSAIDFTGVSGAERAYLLTRLFDGLKQSLMVIVPGTKDAQEIMADMRFFAGARPLPLVYLPPYNILPFKRLGYHNETAASRVRALFTVMSAPYPMIMITTMGALLNRVMPKTALSEFSELIMAGEEIDRDRLLEKLVRGGYSRSVIVEEPGDYSVRGGILDIYSPMYDEPMRIELFGDTVESLRFFSSTTQRTLQDIGEAVILPAGETILKKENIPEIVHRLRVQASSLDLPLTKVREIADRIASQQGLPDIAGLIPFVYDRLHSFLDYIPPETDFVLIDPPSLEKSARTLTELVERNYQTVRREKRLCVSPDALYLDWEKVVEKILSRHPLMLQTLPVVKGEGGPEMQVTGIHAEITDNTGLKASLENPAQLETLPLTPLASWIDDNLKNGICVLVVCSTQPRARRLKSLLEHHGVQLEIVNGFSDALLARPSVYACVGRLSAGFVWPGEFLAVVTEQEIFGHRRVKSRSRPRKRAVELLNLEDLKAGDLIVHEDHGIGRYEGLAKLGLNDSINDFLLVVYRDDDKLYVPVDRMEVIQKYMGVDGVTPVLDKMGGKSWERVKTRVKRSAEKMAGALLKLYAARKVRKGYAFRELDQDFSAFESGFSYAETSDQLRAIEDVLDDMGRPLPMDRLVCGDVGYGKTEVALRAAFFAVSNGKQVAVLVPTTVLAEQHYATFLRRFKRFPMMIACLNRFRSRRAQREIIEGLKTATVDIVIGTHRLFSKDVGFKDLGLIILDEEQRFGVKHKEKLKKLRQTVDVLALTATPIPRTLHLSLTGIRDISIISTPPEYRQAIITYICELDDAIIKDAVGKELNRKGQVFFVHNNIQTIDAMADHLKKLVPRARLAVAHGRMSENGLESVMHSFVKREIDLLVCTTIIESGLDIPAANTMLINRADRFGLAQMYQLRGRIGRSDQQAYAYLFIPVESTLTKDAQKRLKVLMEHSDLGSGFQIAMSDLKIRGGGTILGASQSGHIAAVGYDMFLKLMEEAVTELKGDRVVEVLTPEIQLRLSAYIPEFYITDIDQRLALYRRLTGMTTLREISDFKSELIDRFGGLPPEVNNLLLKIMLKVLAGRAGVKKLDLTGPQLLFYLSPRHQRKPAAIVDMVAAKPDRLRLTTDQVLMVNSLPKGAGGLISQTKNILKEIVQHVNS